MQIRQSTFVEASQCYSENSSDVFFLRLYVVILPLVYSLPMAAIPKFISGISKLTMFLWFKSGF